MWHWNERNGELLDLEVCCCRLYHTSMWFHIPIPFHTWILSWFVFRSTYPPLKTNMSIHIPWKLMVGLPPENWNSNGKSRYRTGGTSSSHLQMLDFTILTLVCWGRSHLLIHTHLNCSVMLPRASLGTCWVAWRNHATWNLADGVGSFFYPKIKLVFYPFLFWGCKVIYDIKSSVVSRRFRPDYTFCGQFLFHIYTLSNYFASMKPTWKQ